MKTLSQIREGLRNRATGGENPYMNSSLNGILCRLHIDPATLANACVNVGEILQLLSQNEHEINQGHDTPFPALEQS